MGEQTRSTDFTLTGRNKTMFWSGAFVGAPEEDLLVTFCDWGVVEEGSATVPFLRKAKA